MLSRSLGLAILGPGLVCSMAGGCSRKPSAEEHIRKAQAYADQSRLPEAIVEYRLALQADPRRGDARLKLADLYVRTREGGTALKEYVRAADLLPNDPVAQIKAGNILLRAGSFEDAKSRAQRVLALDPRNPDAQILLGNALARLKDMNGALAEYQQAIALNPTHDSAYVNVGAIQFARGQRTEAEATFKKAIEVAPKSVAARLALANFFWATNRAPEAEQTLKDALLLDPANLEANRAVGIFYIASNRAKEAEPYFQAIAKSAKTTEATLGLADYYGYAGRFDDAKKVLRDLASKKDAYAVAMTRLAAVDAAQGARAQGLSKLREVLDKYPKDVGARLLSARLLLVDGKRDEAMAEARTIISDEPNSTEAGEAYAVIGGIQAALDHRDEAIKAYEEVLQREGRPLAAYQALAALHLAGGSLDKATTYAQLALTIQPGNPLARAQMVRILLAQHNQAKAAEELASLQRDFPTAPTVQNLVAAQQLANRHSDEARAAFVKALKVDPHDLEATAGLVQLDLASGHASDAVNRVEVALKTPAMTGDFLMMAAQTYSAVGKTEKAEELLQKAIELDPARLQAYGLLGGLYFNQHRLDDARDQFRQIVDRNPKSVPANTMLGTILEAQQRLSEAEKQYQKVLAIDSRAAVAANNLAWLYVSSNRNLDEALQLAQTAQQQLPDDSRVNDTLGWIYYRKNMTAAAIRHLESSVQHDASEPASHYHLGMAYVQDGDFQKAKKELQRALAFKTEFDGSADARKTLTQIGS